MFPDTPERFGAIGAASPERIRSAFETLRRAWPAGQGEPSRESLYSVLAVSGLESSYGVGFGSGINNWGAIQCSHGPPCGDTCIEWGDSHSDGTSYRWCYRRYPTAEDGARDLASLLIRRVGVGILSAGNSRTLAEAMYKARYYEGIGPDPEARISRYAAALQGCFNQIGEALGAPASGGSGEPARGSLAFLLAAGAAAYLWKRRKRRG